MYLKKGMRRLAQIGLHIGMDTRVSKLQPPRMAEVSVMQEQFTGRRRFSDRLLIDWKQKHIALHVECMVNLK